MNNNKNLHKYFINNNGKRLHKWFHYINVYERYFSPFIDKKPLVIEIGVFGGGSLEMWSYFFGQDATILGIDINSECKSHENNNIFIEIGDQSDPNFLNKIIEKYGKPDIVIDDGSHIAEHQLASFEFLYPRMKDNSVYLVEDLHCNYWLKNDSINQINFVEFCKTKIDELNAATSLNKVPITDFTKTTNSMHFYDSIVVFEKKLQSKKHYTITGNIDLV